MFIVKVRALVHSPAEVLYPAKFYCKRIMEKKTFPKAKLQMLWSGIQGPSFDIKTTDFMDFVGL